MNVKRFQRIADLLLERHFGINIGDTGLTDDGRVMGLIEGNVRPFEAVNEHADRYDLDRIDAHGPFPPGPLKEADEQRVAAGVPSHFGLNDRYFEEVVGDKVDLFDGIEIQGVREHHHPDDVNDTFIETDNEDPQFYSVYVHLKPTLTSGGTACIGDFETHAAAVAYANELSKKHAWPVYDFAEGKSGAPAPALPGLLSRVALFYCGGEFGGVATQDDIDNSGDGLFRFVMTELAAGEDCDTHAEAVRRLGRAVEQLEEVIDLLEAEGDVPEEHAFLKGVLPQVARFYEGGEFLHVESLQDVADCGDGLFRFLVAELSPTEDCHDAEEAIRRLQTAVSQLRDLEERIAEDSCEDTLEPA